MEKRIHLFVSRKNVLTWLMALCLVGSAVARIVIPCVKGTWDSLEVWSQIVLPVAATLLFVLITLVSGKEMFYKTAIPVFMMGIFYAIQPHSVIGDNPFILGMYYTCILFYCILYTAITSGRIRFPWLLTLLFLLPVAAAVYGHQQSLFQGGLTYPELPAEMAEKAFWTFLPEYLLFLGCFLLTNVLALLLAGSVALIFFNAGAFNTVIEGLSASTGSTGSNPLKVILDIIPSTITAAFSSNSGVLSLVFLAIVVGLALNKLGLGADCTITLKNCTCNGVVITADNYDQYISVELPEGRTLADCV